MADSKRDIKQAYIAGDQDLRDLADWQWPSAEMAALIAARQQHKVPRATLVSELLAQNSHLPDAEAAIDNIQALAAESTFTVTTGHQVCLMGGPMFTLYKIATTIAMARDLAALHPQYRFVPILWMATEDHDWEEINHYFAGFANKITYPANFVGPVGRHVLNESIASILPADLPAQLRAFYVPGHSLAEAFRSLIHHLFGQFGLVILDADRPSLKQSFASAIARELRGEGMAAPVRATSKALEEMGFKAQIYPRDINLFYLGDGTRQLIDRQEGGFKLKDGERTWTEAAMHSELQAHPEHFSPNVALRPVYQETILPNLAYIGGWAEVGYWLQLRDGFRVHGTFYPMVVPRLHATIVQTDQAEDWDSLGLPLAAIAQPIHVLNDLYLAQHWDEATLTAAIAAVDTAFVGLSTLVEEVDPTLATGIRAEQARSDNAFDNLRKKFKKALRNRNPQPYQAIAALKNAIEPENIAQQRTLNFTSFRAIDPQKLAQILVQNAAWQNSEGKWITLP